MRWPRLARRHRRAGKKCFRNDCLLWVNGEELNLSITRPLILRLAAFEQTSRTSASCQQETSGSMPVVTDNTSNPEPFGGLTRLLAKSDASVERCYGCGPDRRN